jgi:hypothetical protein
VLDTTIHKTQDEDKQIKNITQHVLDTTIHKTKSNKTKHNMWWTPQYTRHKTKSNKTKNKTQYVVDTTIHKTKDEDKQNKKQNTIFVGHHHTQDKRRSQTKQKTQHNMCWTPLYTRHKTKTNKIENTTQYVLDTNIRKQHK